MKFKRVDYSAKKYYICRGWRRSENSVIINKKKDQGLRNVVKDFTQAKNILILNKNKDKASQLKSLCGEIWKVYTAPTLSKAISLISDIDFNVVVVDAHMARYSYLRGLFRKSTSIIITGFSLTELKHIVKEWPENQFVDIFLYADLHKDSNNFLRMLFKATEYSRILLEIENLHRSSGSVSSDWWDQEIFKKICDHWIGKTNLYRDKI